MFNLRKYYFEELPQGENKSIPSKEQNSFRAFMYKLIYSKSTKELAPSQKRNIWNQMLFKNRIPEKYKFSIANDWLEKKYKEVWV